MKRNAEPSGSVFNRKTSCSGVFEKLINPDFVELESFLAERCLGTFSKEGKPILHDTLIRRHRGVRKGGFTVPMNRGNEVFDFVENVRPKSFGT